MTQAITPTGDKTMNQGQVLKRGSIFQPWIEMFRLFSWWMGWLFTFSGVAAWAMIFAVNVMNARPPKLWLPGIDTAYASDNFVVRTEAPKKKKYSDDYR